MCLRQVLDLDHTGVGLRENKAGLLSKPREIPIILQLDFGANFSGRSKDLIAEYLLFLRELAGHFAAELGPHICFRVS